MLTKQLSRQHSIDKISISDSKKGEEKIVTIQFENGDKNSNHIYSKWEEVQGKVSQLGKEIKNGGRGQKNEKSMETHVSKIDKMLGKLNDLHHEQ